MATNNKIISIVKARLSLSADSLDALISSYADEIGHRIKHYCNISTIPETLNFVWGSMVIDVLKIEQSTIDEIADTIDSGAAIKIGDTSISPSKADGTTSTSKKTIEAIVLNYAADLNHYRRLRW